MTISCALESTEGDLVSYGSGNLHRRLVRSNKREARQGVYASVQLRMTATSNVGMLFHPHSEIRDTAWKRCKLVMGKHR